MAKILLNGNAASEAALLSTAAPLLQATKERNGARRILLITAGWAEEEHNEAHVKRALNNIGLPSYLSDGFDQNLQNLSLFHSMRGVLGSSSELAAHWGSFRSVAQTARQFYLEHNAHLIALLRRVLVSAKLLDSSLSVAKLSARASREIYSLEGSHMLQEILSGELRQLLHALEENDDRFVSLLERWEARTFQEAGILYDPAWRAQRARLEERILSASAIVFFGGRLDLLLEGLRFFRLQEPLSEALRRDTLFLGTSAGAMVLGERVIVYDDFAEKPRDFQLFERGLGLVREFQLFPHCMDRIQTDDPNNLAYLARRFRYHSCVGLNEGSFLLLETSPRRAVSWGHTDGVYVFDQEGRKLRYNAGAEIPLQLTS